MEKIGILVELDGAAKFKEHLSDINRGVKALTNESKLLTSEFHSFSSSSARVESIQKSLAATTTQHVIRVQHLVNHYKELEQEGKKSAGTMAYWRSEIARAQLAAEEASNAFKEFKWGISQNQQAVSTYEAELRMMNATFTEEDDITRRVVMTRQKLSEAIKAQETVVASLNAKYQDTKARLGEDAEATMRAREEFANAKTKLAELNKEFQNTTAATMWAEKLAQNAELGRQKIAVFDAELDRMRASLSETATEEERAAVEISGFTKKADEQRAVIKNLESAHKLLVSKYGENSSQVLRNKEAIERAKTALLQYEAVLRDNSPFAVYQRNLEKDLRLNEQSVRTYQAVLDRLNASYTKNDGVVSRSAQNQKVLRDAIKSQENVVRDLNTQYGLAASKYGKNSEQALKLREALERAKIELKQLNDEFNKNSVVSKYGEAMQKTGEKIMSAGQKMSSFGRSMTMYVTTPLLTAGAYAVKTASDFESSFADVRKVLDASEAEFQAIKNGIKDMSTETASTKEEISQVVATVGRLGVSLGQNGSNILNFSKVMVELGDVTDMTSDEIANALGKFVAVTGMSQDKIENLGSAVVSLGNHFAASESEIIPMMQKMSAAGKIAGLTEQEIAALSTALAATGVKAEAGGTAMTKTFTTLNKIVSDYAKGSTENLDLIANLAGVSAQHFADAWRNEPMKALQMFFDAIGSVSDDSIQLDAVLKQLGLTNIRQTVAVKNLARANEMLDDAVAMANEEFEKNTALSNAASKRYQTFEARLSQLKEEVKNTASEFGEALMPVLNDVMAVVKKGVKQFSSLSKTQKENILKTAAFVAALGPAVTLIGKLTTGVGAVVTQGGKFLSWLGEAGKGTGLLTTVLGNMGTIAPIAVGGIAAITLAYTSYKSSIYGLTDAHEKEMAKLKESYASYDNATAKVSTMAARLDELQSKEELTVAEKAEVASIVKTLNSELDGLNMTYDATTGKVDNYTDSVKDNIDALKEQARTARALEKLEKIYSDLYDAEEELAKINEKVTQAEANFSEEVASGATDVEVATSMLQDLNNERDIAYQKVEELKAIADDEAAAYEKLANETSEVTSNTQELATVTGETEDAMESLDGEIENEASEYDKLAESIKEANNKKREGFELMEYEKQSYDDMKKALESQIQTYTNYNSNLQEVQSYVESLDGAEREMAERLLQYAVDMGIEGAGHMQTLAESTRDGGSAFMELAGELNEADAASNATSESMTQVQASAQGLSQSVETASADMEKSWMASRDTTTSATEEIAQTTKEKADQIPKSIGDAMTNMRIKLANGMTTAQTTARNGANNMYNAANSKTGQFASIGMNMGQGLINGLNSKSGLLWNTAYSIVSGAVQQMQAAAQVHSPSRATYWIADMMDEGMADGFTENAYKPINAAKRMVNGVLGATSSLFGKNNGASTLSLTSGFNAANIYQAVKEGASAATINVYLDDREVSRSLKGLGVAFA